MTGMRNRLSRAQVRALRYAALDPDERAHRTWMPERVTLQVLRHHGLITKFEPGRPVRPTDDGHELLKQLDEEDNQ